MNWLCDNPIANMYGPSFVVFFGLAACVVVGVSRVVMGSRGQRPAGLRLAVASAAAGLILCLGGYKLSIALSRGHFNIWFLVLIAVASSLYLFHDVRPDRPNPAGQQYK